MVLVSLCLPDFSHDHISPSESLEYRRELPHKFQIGMNTHLVEDKEFVEYRMSHNEYISLVIIETFTDQEPGPSQLVHVELPKAVAEIEQTCKYSAVSLHRRLFLCQSTAPAEGVHTCLPW